MGVEWEQDVDINELCTEFTNKARCDGTKVVLEPEGVHHIIEVGGPATIDRSLNCVRMGGYIHVIGFLDMVRPSHNLKAGMLGQSTHRPSLNRRRRPRRRSRSRSCSMPLTCAVSWSALSHSALSTYQLSFRVALTHGWQI